MCGQDGHAGGIVGHPAHGARKAQAFAQLPCKRIGDARQPAFDPQRAAHGGEVKIPPDRTSSIFKNKPPRRVLRNGLKAQTGQHPAVCGQTHDGQRSWPACDSTRPPGRSCASSTVI